MAGTTDRGVDLRRLSDAYFEAWADGDVDRILSLHTDDTRFQIHAGTEPSVGLAAVRDAVEGVFAHWPNLRLEPRRVLLGTDHWVLDWTLVAQHPEAGEIRFDCLDVVVVSPDGRVASKDTYIDTAQLQAALGAA